MVSDLGALMPPPWLRYPRIPAGVIGWRMGPGEQYANEWDDWFRRLRPADQVRYRGWFPPPPTWRGFYDPEYGLDYDSDEGYSCTGPAHWSVSFFQRYGLPRYNRQMLVDAGWEGEFVFFWKPTPGLAGPGCLGQWQPSRFVLYDECVCAEQHMMAEKARLFGDAEVLAQILATDDPKRMKALGGLVKNFDAAVWDKAKYSIVLQGNYAKFTQDEALREFLVATTGKVLVEASPLDTIWGIGLGKDNPKASDPAQWRGQNLLGFALMEVRDEITKVYANYDRIDWTRYQ